MYKIAVIAALLVVCCAAAPLKEEESQFLFGKWTEQHNKNYESVEEFFARYNTWKLNMEYVLAHSSKNKTYTLAMNQFGDMTNDEFRSMYNNYAQVGEGRTVHCGQDARLATVAPQASVNWVAKGKVTPVKNQGQCGSCWSFSTTGSLESMHAIKYNELISLSEQELVDCAGGPYGNQGCNGGMMQDAFDFIGDVGGLCTEASYPYQAVDGTCRNTSCKAVVTLTGCVNVPQNSESGLEAAVNLGAVSVAVDAGGSDWQFYSGGVLNDSGCGTELDHGVLAAGYDTLNGQAYWLVKNSWGTGWGVNGYIYLAKGVGGSGECGIAMDASYPTV